MLGSSRSSFALVVATLVLLAPYASSQCKFQMTEKLCYAPPEVFEPHSVHELTIFLPLVPPPPDAPLNGMGQPLYPTVLYSPAGAFGQGTTEGTQPPTTGSLFGEFEPLPTIGKGLPASSNLKVLLKPGQQPPPLTESAPLCGFLDTALLRGWAVVTVGTTGWNSWPVCSQVNDCNECQNLGTTNPLCAGTLTCRDTNLWIDPASAEWDDFDVYSGEKEFTWARQWIGEHGADHLLDTDRVVVCGTSTGAIYSAFLAFGPNRAWGPLVSFPGQSRQDTRVAGMVAFEPNVWVRALSTTSPGVHWPSSTDPLDDCGSTGIPCIQGGPCYNRRAPTTSTAGFGLVEQSSISRWVRAIEGDEQPTPVFIASGDGGFTTGFARDANLPAHAADYERHLINLGCGTAVGPNPALVTGDPLLEYSAGPELFLHDSWNAINFRIDLALLDVLSGDTTHALRSRLYLQEGQAWGNLPPCLSLVAPSPPTSASEVTYLDGTFPDYNPCPCPPTEPLSAINNVALAPDVVTWMEAAIGVERGAGAVVRNPPLVGGSVGPPCVPSVVNGNLDVYRATTPWDGLPVLVEIDLDGTGYDEADLLFFEEPSAPCEEFVLGGGRTVLCDLSTALDDLSTGFVAADMDGVVRITLGAGTPPGASFCTQAVLRDTSGMQTYALTNAVDLTVQFMP